MDVDAGRLGSAQRRLQLQNFEKRKFRISRSYLLWVVGEYKVVHNFVGEYRVVHNFFGHFSYIDRAPPFIDTMVVLQRLSPYIEILILY